jgi:putative tricarboxylic transport membrane protein
MAGLSRRSMLKGLLAIPAGAVVGGCAGTVVQTGDLSRLRILVPASPGGGWDTTSRELQRTIQREGIARNVQVFNVEGAGGIIGLGQLARESDDALLMTMGLVMLGAVLTNESPTTLEDVTPIARLTGEQEILVVPGDSPFETVADFVEAWLSDPRGQPIAGGSAGGTDQILAGLMAQAVGVDPKSINYIPYSGGGESLAALLGGQVAAGISGVGEYAEQVNSGDLRGLATSGTEPTQQLPDVPTLIDEGIDVELINWRGVMARPDMSEEARTDLIELVTDVHDSDQWADVLETQGWDDEFLPGGEYGQFIVEEQDRVKEILVSIGLVR